MNVISLKNATFRFSNFIFKGAMNSIIENATKAALYSYTLSKMLYKHYYLLVKMFTLI